MLDQPRMWAHLQYDYSRQEFSPLLHDLINWMSGRGLERNLTVCKYGWGWGRGEGGTQRAALGCQSHHYAEADLTRCLGEVWFSNRLVLKSECYKCYSLYNWGKDITHRKWLQFSIFWAPVTKETLTKWLKEIDLMSKWGPRMLRKDFTLAKCVGWKWWWIFPLSLKATIKIWHFLHTHVHVYIFTDYTHTFLFDYYYFLFWLAAWSRCGSRKPVYNPWDSTSVNSNLICSGEIFGSCNQDTWKLVYMTGMN